jgi:hypothetical protein
MANFQNIKGITLQKEGGLSRATTDSASRNPSPYVYQGKTGWHTNKGVTYTTFVEASKRYGFANNEQNFIYMPEAIWDKIAKGMYWDYLKLDNLKSDGVAIQLFSLVWGGLGWFNRMQKYLSSKGINWDKSPSTLTNAINTLIDRQGEKQTIDDLDVVQQEYYKALNQPANTRGWINRVKDTTKYAYNYIGKVINVVTENKKTRNYVLLGVGLLIISSVSYLYFKNRK